MKDIIDLSIPFLYNFIRYRNRCTVDNYYITCSHNVFSASGCPIANRNKMRVMENYNAVEQHKAALAAVNVTGSTTPKLENIGNCMSSGCDPTGHLNGSFLTHRAITNCSNNKKPAISKYPSPQAHNDLYQLYQKGLNSKFSYKFFIVVVSNSIRLRPKKSCCRYFYNIYGLDWC